MTDKIQIAVSACLLGHKVRYDGKEKRHSMLMDMFLYNYSDSTEPVPFCPETAIGLGVPRAKIQVIRRNDGPIRVVGVEHHTLDVTEELQSYAESFIRQHPDVLHYIVKSKSPSCGYGSTPLFITQADNNKQLIKTYDYSEQSGFTSGLFVQTLKSLKPELVIIEETQLDSEDDCIKFFQSLRK